MPEHLKSAPNSKEFQKYLESFMKKKERQHRRKVMQDIMSSVSMIIAS